MAVCVNRSSLQHLAHDNLDFRLPEIKALLALRGEPFHPSENFTEQILTIAPPEDQALHRKHQHGRWPLMANHAEVKENDLVFDPFVGTGSLLEACVCGTDIDYNTIHGKAPYGIRESTRRTGSHKEIIKPLDGTYSESHVPVSQAYHLSDIFTDLLNFSAQRLLVGGRLVYWLPVYRPDQDGLCLLGLIWFSQQFVPSCSLLQIISVKDSSHRLSLCSSVESEPEEHEELEDTLPVLRDRSRLLHDHHLLKLAAHMPPRTQGYPWNLVYSTAIHGSSLKTLYRNMADLDSPVLLVIKDMHKQVFGAFSSDPFRVSKYCYGTGETFLFSFNPDFQHYRWSGENSYFMSGNKESLHIGGGRGGGFALWLDADLYHGASSSCPTFHNPPLSTHEDFLVQDVEVWTVRS